ncbi:MAG: hypothetical protein CL607_12025 [Anaerolineaceae bacterium]|nr:hypothetical protein [Anaerolineaceae bacterium]
MAQEGKGFAATVALVIGLTLGTNYMVTENKDNNWLMWAIIFLVLAAALWIWMQRESKSADENEAARRADEATDAIRKTEEQIERLTAKTEANLTRKAAPEPAAKVVEAPEPIEKVEPAEETPPVEEAPVPDVEAEVVPEPEPEPAPTPAPAPAPAVASDEPDDLTKVEGIGPKYNDTLIAAGVSTFAAIAELSEEQLVKIIRDAGMRKPPSVGSWAQQAKLAAEGKWDELEELQNNLTAGRK